MNFTMQHSELMKFMQESPDMRTAASGSLKQGLYAGGAAISLGLLMGPLGGMIGGIAGSIYGYMNAPNYDGALAQIQALPDAQKEKLVGEVAEILVAAGAVAQGLSLEGGMAAAMAQYANTPAVRDQVWNAVVTTATM